ncbi:GD16634 [Drosophila simulans]|uniref:GD16634 n=1 Tax=Drosophila simulans TaxID=7240 RepID=B4R3X0_DROSI|nr:GD16634 [Drosophila simulans]
MKRALAFFLEELLELEDELLELVDESLLLLLASVVSEEEEEEDEVVEVLLPATVVDSVLVLVSVELPVPEVLYRAQISTTANSSQWSFILSQS